MVCYHWPVPRFEPFIGLRYDLDQFSLADVTAPPYDVVSEQDRADLIARSDHNVVAVDLPDEADGPQRYQAAARQLDGWVQQGLLQRDGSPSFTVYRMGFTDDRGRPAHTLGVIGALQLSGPGDGQVLPHEHTTPKAKSDRLELLRATGTNLSAIWGLSLTEGLTALLETPGQPMQAWTDDDGVDHAVWRIDDDQRSQAIAEAVGASPVVIADGHHRYETALTYRDERAASDGGPGMAGATMCFIVELVTDELSVRPIHRLLSGFDPDLDLAEALSPWFEPGEVVAVDGSVLDRMDRAGALALVRPDRRGRLLTPRPEALTGADDLDSSRLEVALQALGSSAQVAYQHGVDNVVDAVAGGRAQFGILLRPASVDQIAANARSGKRMPAKTTFFHPKPKTGLVLRPTTPS